LKSEVDSCRCYKAPANTNEQTCSCSMRTGTRPRMAENYSASRLLSFGFLISIVGISCFQWGLLFGQRSKQVKENRRQDPRLLAVMTTDSILGQHAEISHPSIRQHSHHLTGCTTQKPKFHCSDQSSRAVQSSTVGLKRTKQETKVSLQTLKPVNPQQHRCVSTTRGMQV